MSNQVFRIFLRGFSICQIFEHLFSPATQFPSSQVEWVNIVLFSCFKLIPHSNLSPSHFHVGDLQSLIILDLSRNKLTELTSTLLNLRLLRELFLEGNELSPTAVLLLADLASYLKFIVRVDYALLDSSILSATNLQGNWRGYG